MYITAFLHRDELFDITNRWLSDKPAADDPLRITRIITYDSYAAWEKLRCFAAALNQRLTDTMVLRKTVCSKKELKDFICATAESPTERIRHLIETYRKMPEYHYIGSPMAGHIYHQKSGRMVSMCRMKRVKRIAEKTSRYAALHIMRTVQEAMPPSCDHRPCQDSPTADLLACKEEKHMCTIRRKGLTLPVEAMTISDVIGIKVIRNGISEDAFESLIAGFPGATIIEKETHAGNYNAIHYIVELQVDPSEIISRFDSRKNPAMFRNRGLPENRLAEDFKDFMHSGARTLQVDIILISFDELVESEIGRSMHEARIFQQRRQQHLYGNIPINIEYLIEYLIAVGLSPTVHIDEIPIKIWGRYLPDTLSHHVRALYQMPGYSIIHP